jgi:hypothetical protein
MAVGALEPGKGPAVRTDLNRAAPAEDGRATYPNVNDVQRTFGVSWGQLVELEPQLKTLLGRVRLAGARCRNSADVDRVFGPLRDELAALIGFAGKHHSHPVLGSAGAYEVAYWKLYGAVARLLSGGGAREAPAKQRDDTDSEPCSTESASA